MRKREYPLFGDQRGEVDGEKGFPEVEKKIGRDGRKTVGPRNGKGSADGMVLGDSKPGGTNCTNQSGKFCRRCGEKLSGKIAPPKGRGDATERPDIKCEPRKRKGDEGRFGKKTKYIQERGSGIQQDATRAGRRIVHFSSM